MGKKKIIEKCCFDGREYLRFVSGGRVRSAIPPDEIVEKSKKYSANIKEISSHYRIDYGLFSEDRIRRTMAYQPNYFMGSGSFFFVNPVRVYKNFSDIFSPVECAALNGVYLDARLGGGVLIVPHDRDRDLFLRFADFLLCREEKTAAVAV